MGSFSKDYRVTKKLRHQLVYLVDQHIGELFFRNLSDELSLLKEDPLAAPPCNADIRLLGLTRAIDHTTHDGHLGRGLDAG